MDCKNIDCNNSTKGKNIYCSLKCRNIYVNKYLRDYSKCSQTFEKNSNLKKSSYLINPKLCLCGKIIPFNKRVNTYCNSSCAATFNNSKKDYSLFSEKIKNSVHKYLIDNNIKEEQSIGKYKLICKYCELSFLNKRKVKFCSTSCRKNLQRINMTEYQKYKSDCSFKFNFGNYPNEFDFSLIREYGWYSPTNKNNNLSGVSRDHMFSVNDGFKHGIDAKLLAHPANCKLMIHTENISKNKTSSITLIELLQRIEAFDKKYLIK